MLEELPHQGTDLSLHTHAVTYGILALPVLLAFGGDGPPGIFGVYNLIVLVSFTLAAYFSYRLALTLTGDRRAALLAAVVFAYSNFRFANTVRLHVLATEWLVLTVWTAVLLWQRPSPARLVGFTLAGVLLLNASLELTASTAALLAVALAVAVAQRLRVRPLARGQRGRGQPGGRAHPVRSSDLLALTDPRNAIFVRELGRPGALAALGAEGTARAVADLRAYLVQYEISWIVVPSDPGCHEWAVGTLFPASRLGAPLYAAYQENLRLLRPVEEVEIEGFTLFRF
jgi:hypothetical protein